LGSVLPENQVKADRHASKCHANDERVGKQSVASTRHCGEDQAQRWNPLLGQKQPSKHQEIAFNSSEHSERVKLLGGLAPGFKVVFRLKGDFELMVVLVRKEQVEVEAEHCNAETDLDTVDQIVKVKVESAAGPEHLHCDKQGFDE
jgi:hypothetical protein